MKKFILMISPILFFTTCKKPLKNIEDYYPKVETVSAVVQDDGSVLVLGKINAQGESKVDLVGFCMSKDPIPTMLENQINELELFDDEFSASYPTFELNTRYYFRAWASNGFGYSYGNVIFLDSIRALDVTAPCTPTLNTVSNGLGSTEKYYTAKPNQNFDDWTINATSNANNIEYVFYEKPKTGIYKTVTYNPPGPGSIYISNRSGFSSGNAVAGSKVYVNKLEPDKWEITICSADFKYSSNTTSFTTKFICPQ